MAAYNANVGDIQDRPFYRSDHFQIQSHRDSDDEATNDWQLNISCVNYIDDLENYVCKYSNPPTHHIFVATLFMLFLDPRPDLGLRPAYFDVFASPATTPAQRRCQFGWNNQWKLNWRQLCRRGRYNSARGRYMDDELLHCPINIEHYRGAPAVWCDMPTGTYVLGYVATL